MSIWAVVPVQHLTRAKSRLSAHLSDPERQAIMRRTIAQVISTLVGSAEIERVLVVTPDPEVVRFVEARGAEAVVQHGSGLNKAILMGRAVAIDRGATGLMIVLGDLPLLDTETISDLILASRDIDVVLAPDRHDSGTNIMLLHPPDVLEPRFGLDSFQVHRESASRAGLSIAVFRSLNSGFDIDTPADLRDLDRIGWLTGQAAD